MYSLCKTFRDIRRMSKVEHTLPLGLSITRIKNVDFRALLGDAKVESMDYYLIPH